MDYVASSDRYSGMAYRKVGRWGLKLPLISLGLWHNFGRDDDYNHSRAMIHRAFDLGITHFDLANNYGPPAGSAEETMGRILRDGLGRYRDEVVISTKAGYHMWAGPYGEWGSRKHIISSLDQSLKRMGVDYVDVYYHHRPDPNTPIDETMSALDDVVKQGKALYVGISNYDVNQTRDAVASLQRIGRPLLIHQSRYSMFNRLLESGLQDALQESGVGSIAFSPLHQGMLTNRYFDDVPKDSRAMRDGRFLKPEQITSDKLEKAKKLQVIAQRRDQTLAQMALAWVLREGRVSSALIGASKLSQIDECVRAVENQQFVEDELREIDAILGDAT